MRNAAGQRFMPNYHDLAELAPRDVVSRAIFSEMQAMETNHVFLDLSAIKVDIPSRFPTIFKRCMEAKIDIRKQFIPVAPGAHYFIGGIEVDEYGCTDIQGLYAVGEVAATDVHGANRLASNSLLEGLVFGARAALHAQGRSIVNYSSIASTASFNSEQVHSNGLHSFDTSTLMMVRQTVQQVMWDCVGISRDEPGLKRALTVLKTHSDVLDLPHVSELVVEAKSLLQLAILTRRRCNGLGLLGLIFGLI